jgi:uncharacterized protein (TIGR02421 family)
MKPVRLSIREIIKKIELSESIEAITNDGGFIVKINKYVPYCCTAIHNGNKVRTDLKKKIALNEYERWYEEDPHTADFIASMPISIIALDSRYEYDLNRKPDSCIYEEAWGKKVWKTKLTSADKKKSLQKHSDYYKVLHALISKLENMFGGCVVYDFHSYNYKRWDREVPLFNVGTEKLNKEKYAPYITHWLNELSAIELPDLKNISSENDVFYGRGYNLEYLNAHFSNTLVLATEIKKVYCDEETGDIYPKVIRQIHQNLKKAILNNALFFSNKLMKWKNVSISKLLDQQLNDDLLKVDQSLFSLLRNFELLAVVNPVNSNSERKKFFKNNFNRLPTFKYSPIKINPFDLKQRIFSIPIKNIQDIGVRSLYESTISAYSDKIDMIAALNTEKFLYTSLRYFGRPTKTDLFNANYILMLPGIPNEPKNVPTITAKKAMEFFKLALEGYKINAKVEFSNKVISQVMVLNSKKTVLIQPEAKFTMKAMQALMEHEIGVHMLTTINSNHQPLKLFNLGLPKNTLTQEGLAILSEYLSGNISLQRLKKIALRVVAVDMMCNGADFIEVFSFLVNEFNVEENDAFSITTRIFRGGGFTKDYLYLNGFVQIYRLWEDNYDISPLLIGKTSLPFLSTIEEMAEREMVKKPQLITQSFINPQIHKNNPIFEYIFSGLRYED